MSIPVKPTLSATLIVIILAGCIPPAPMTASTPTPVPVAGSPGMNDPYYPNLGNGGYDVQHYTIVLDIDPPNNTIRGSATITATATEFLESFNLDLQGLEIDALTVNESPANYSRNNHELTITSEQPLPTDELFNVVVQYHGSPGLVPILGGPFEMGWSHGEGGVINVWGEPDAASAWFPNNNHPRDKATFSFEITVPNPWIVAATGALLETVRNGEQTTFIWEMTDPMATYLASINIDQYEVVAQEGPNGLSIRNYFPVDFPPSLRRPAAVLPAVIDFFDDLFGPYPFDEYGVVIAGTEGFCTQTETALETQSMSLHCPSVYMTSETVLVHEVAHQWFGDSVSLENWKDIWLKEGMATYAEWLWDSGNDPEALKRTAKFNENYFFDSPNSIAEPAQNNLYTQESYTGGALVFHALHLQVGDEVFFDILRSYTERYRGAYAGTDEFIALAEEVSGLDLQSFFDAWLFSERLPDLPE
ncbi:MAG TPA: M1 family metallopeptidase [Anaerolineales bacterium]|nr:M1 family metallopeptidase [Anaerolineales bacterium]